MIALFVAIAIVESGGNPNAVGDNGLAVGIVQIQPCVVADCNEWLRRHKHKTRFTLKDRRSITKSYQMFVIYLNRWASGKSQEHKARCWNGGPKGHTKKATLSYWRRVKQALNSKQIPESLVNWKKIYGY